MLKHTHNIERRIVKGTLQYWIVDTYKLFGFITIYVKELRVQ